MVEVCETCNLPQDLCVCEDIEKSESEVSIKEEERSMGKKMTIISELDDSIDGDELASELKSNLACGGTFKDGEIQIQGTHSKRAKEILEDKGFSVTITETVEVEN